MIGNGWHHYCTYVCIIAERISTRHWIADCGPGIGSCMFVCMSVMLLECAMATLFVPQLCMYLCMRLHACMHALQLMYQYLDYNTSKMRWCILFCRLNSVINNSGFCWKYLVGGPTMMISDSALSRRTPQVWFSILTWYDIWSTG